MNSADDISVYKEPKNHYQPTLTRIGHSYDIPEKSPKKDKKWSIGSLFRRKKKDGVECSSDEETHKKSFLNKRRKPETKRSKRQTGTFDHVVIPQLPRHSQLIPSYNHEDTGILSDPTGGFTNYIGRALPKIPATQDNSYKNVVQSREVLGDLQGSIGSGSADSLNKRSRRELAKARAEARRTTLKRNSSSEDDDDSQRSNSSLRMRSEENLMRQRDSSLNRRTRAARTERYLKRHSRDGENPHNYLRLSKSDAENSTLNWKLSDDSNRSPSRSPLFIKPNNVEQSLSSLNSQSSISGLSTIPPSHGNHSKFRVSNSTSNPSYKPPLSMNEYNNSIRKSQLNMAVPTQEFLLNSHRSISCDANIHKTEPNPEIIHVQLPLTKPNARHRNLSLIDASQIRNVKQPPPPPPRDPSRLVTAHYVENERPNTFYFENVGHLRSKSINMPFNLRHNNVQNMNKNLNNLYEHQSFKSASEDHLPIPQTVQMVIRPTSVTPDLKSQRYKEAKLEVKPTTDFNYLTDKKPRSRKPIFIESNPVKDNLNGTKTALDFWKQMDKDKVNRMSQEKPTLKSRSNSPQMFTSHTNVQTQVFLPSVVQNDYKDLPKKSILKPTNSADVISDKDLHTRRKSSNLEEALDELEAIFNSLGLGDEDLLERAEQREKEAAEQKALQNNVNPYDSYGAHRGAISDSNFSYEPFDTVDSPRKKLIKKASTFDRRSDDMACRKLHKERASTIGDPQSVSNISYLLATPFSGEDNLDAKSDGKEPDITFDDVVYKRIKHANNTLKVAEPQPPFGIPIGPIAPAANSDYLHAIPDPNETLPFKQSNIPDIVKDDLAYRNLRKDSNKRVGLPQLSTEDFRNNNNNNCIADPQMDLNFLKKRRAVRSLSANIGSLISKDIIEKARNRSRQNNENSETLTDIADAMKFARNVLKEKDNNITATRKAFMSDTDTKYVTPSSNSSSLKESRLKFLNGLTQKHEPSANLGDNLLQYKPPHGLSPDRRLVKESTPIPLSPFEDHHSSNSSLDEFLDSIAKETKETTERISNELRLLSEEKERNSHNDTKQKLSEIDAVSEHAKLCEKLLECVVDSTELIASTKTSVEEVEQIEDMEPDSIELVANVVLSRECSVHEDLKANDEHAASDSEHDYENLVSDKELNIDEIPFVEDTAEDNKCKSPFEEHKAELIASFQELKQNMEQIDSVLSRSHQDNDETASKTASVYDNLEDKTDGVTGEPCVSVLEVLPNEECANKFEPRFTTNCELILKAGTDLADDSETSSGFHSNCSCNNDLANYYLDPMDSLESLKSPKLVLQTAKFTRSVDQGDDGSRATTSGLSLRNSGRELTKSDSNCSKHINSDDKQSDSAWYRDPATMAVACSYGVACALQMASLDLVAILGIVFAIISFIAALMY